MRATIRLFLAMLACLLSGNLARAGSIDTGHLVAELVAESASVAPGDTIQLALVQTIDKGWHTYWRNPGDSGEPTSIIWSLPEGWKAGEIVWATPQRLPVGPLLNYGYEGKVVLPIALSVPANAALGATTLKADVTFLVCAEICIPENAKLEIILDVANVSREAGPNAKLISDALAAAPKPSDFAGVMTRNGGAVHFAFTGKGLGPAVSEAYFFPYNGKLIEHAAPQALDRGKKGITLSTRTGSAFKRSVVPQEAEGVLVVNGAASEVKLTSGPAPAGAAGLGALPSKLAPETSLGFPLALLFAFLGGLILNLMPCVFPILAMKAAALADHAHAPKNARRQALFFLAGVLVTFLGLAAMLLVLREGGAAIGWGFQLQSPEIVAGLSLLLLLIALNLAGVFEVAGALQNAGAGLAARKGNLGAFLTGILAVIVAAPCTAPFMAGALGFALTASFPVALGVFAGLGLGFAAPFVLIAFSPRLLVLLPRPGAWMDRLRVLLSFPMFGAVAWLVWVLSVQTGPQALAALLAALIVAAFAAWTYGLYQRSAKIAWAIAALLAAIATVALLVGASRTGEAGRISAPETSLAFETYSPQRLAQLQSEGRPVFVNFTAAWCITCQVNERLALSGAAVAKTFSDNNVAYLKADWTRRDENIAKELARHGRAGVPLYLVYDAKGSAPVILPQLLTEDIVAKALEKAARKGS